MKILTFTPHGEIPDRRGFSVALVAQNFSKNFKNIEHLHVCAAEQSRDGFEIDPEYGAIHRIREGKLYRRLFRKWTKIDPYPLYRRMAHVANRFQPHIIHVHQQEFPVDEFRRYLKTPAKIVVHSHTIRNFEPQYGLADLYVGVSEYLRDHLVHTGVPEDRVAFVHNGIFPDLFSPVAASVKAEMREAMGLDPNGKIVLYFGRKQAVKGFDLFLRAIKDLYPQHKDLVAIAVGPTPPDSSQEPQFTYMTQMREELSKNGVLKEWNAVQHKELSNFLKIADVAVLPSRDEAQGMAVIEAMAAGLIVISSNVGGIRESITHNHDGLLINPHAETNEVTATLGNVLAAPENYQHLKTAAVQTALTRFSWNNLARELQEIYVGLLR